MDALEEDEEMDRDSAEAGNAMTLALFREKSPAEGVPVESTSLVRPVNFVRLEGAGGETE